MVYAYNPRIGYPMLPSYNAGINNSNIAFNPNMLLQGPSINPMGFWGTPTYFQQPYYSQLPSHFPGGTSGSSASPTQGDGSQLLLLLLLAGLLNGFDAFGSGSNNTSNTGNTSTGTNSTTNGGAVGSTASPTPAGPNPTDTNSSGPPMAWDGQRWPGYIAWPSWNDPDVIWGPNNYELRLT